MTEEGVIGGVGGSGTVLMLVLLLLLRYEGGGPRQSQRIGGLPCPAGRTGGGRVVLVRTDVVTKRSARARYSPWLELGGRGERTVRTASTWRGARGGDWQRVSRPPCCTVTRCDCTCSDTRASGLLRCSTVVRLLHTDCYIPYIWTIFGSNFGRGFSFS